MPASRNPFFIRRAEQADSTDQFLHLFSLASLDILPKDGQWNHFLPIESAPGGGKSTLLRLFTPTVLKSIAGPYNRPEFRDLVTKLTNLGAIDGNEVQLLGFLVNCKEDYSELVDVPYDKTARGALFWALLHSRLALLAIRAVLQLTDHQFPSDVDVIRFEPRSDGVFTRPDARTITGGDLFQRAGDTEQRVVDLINSFSAKAPSFMDGPAVENFFRLLNTHQILVNGETVARHTLIMFDDAHFLDVSQRNLLTTELRRNDQNAFASWMAMRYRALEAAQLISEAVRTNREELSTARFETLGPARIESWLLDVGKRRGQQAQLSVPSFDACLEDSLEAEFNNSQLVTAAMAERENAYRLAQPHGKLYDAWLSQTASKASKLSPHEQAIQWSQVQIMMERRIGKMQGEFTFEALSPVEVDNPGPDTLEAATMFVADRNDLPFFYGAKRVAHLASTNVEQFLSLSGELFDLLLNTGKLGRRHLRPLPPTEQHRLIMARSRAYIDDIRSTVPYGRDVHNLVTAIGDLCREDSWRPNVPITPGVTGFSIRLSERNALIEAAKSSDGTEKRLLNALASAVAHNVLSIRITERLRDEDRAVFYLNRLACPAFDLPLGFGGYKQQKLPTLYDWVSSGRSSRQQRLGVSQST